VASPLSFIATLLPWFQYNSEKILATVFRVVELLVFGWFVGKGIGEKGVRKQEKRQA
jgi:hypothetical protein